MTDHPAPGSHELPRRTTARVWGGVALIVLVALVPLAGAVVMATNGGWLAASGTALALLVLALFLLSDMAMGQVIEPLLYGHSTGLSPIAVILSAAFWAFLWGPVGLLIATPLTVCGTTSPASSGTESPTDANAVVTTGRPRVRASRITIGWPS